MGLRKPSLQEFPVVGIVGFIGAIVQAALGNIGWATGVVLVAVGKFWRGRRAKLSSHGAAYHARAADSLIAFGSSRAADAPPVRRLDILEGNRVGGVEFLAKLSGDA